MRDLSAPNPALKDTLRSPHLLIAQCAGVGLIPLAPGTWGALAGVGMYAGLSLFDPAIKVVGYVAIFICAVWAVQRAGEDLGEHDHGSIVIDEALAMSLVLEMAPSTATGWIAAFALFRLFDIWKPWPIDVVDRRLNNAFGVMLDDVLAAVYAALVLFVAHALGAL